MVRLINAVSNYDWKYRILRHIIWWNNSLYIMEALGFVKSYGMWSNRYFILRLLSCVEFKFHLTNYQYHDSLPAIRFRLMLFNRLKFHFTILVGKRICDH